MSFVEMARYLFPCKSKEFFLFSERNSLDPLENYFGQQRARGGRNENPNMFSQFELRAHVLSVWIVHLFSQFELCAHVLSVWVVHMFSQCELCTCSVLSVWVVHMFPQFELCAHVLSVWVVHVCAQFEFCAQLQGRSQNPGHPGPGPGISRSGYI